MRVRHLLFCALSATGLALSGCPGPAPVASEDAGADASAPPEDTGIDARASDVGTDVGTDGGPSDANVPVTMPIHVVEADLPWAWAYAELLPAELQAGVRMSADPVADVTAAGAGTTRIAVVIDTTIDPEGYRLSQVANGFVVRGGGVLGEQYGLSALLEAMGVRFFHPDASFVPATLATPSPTVFDTTVVPEIGERGIMPWTLHPVEAYWALWEPGGDHLAEAYRIIDWSVKNGIDFFTYPALDDIVGGEARAEWQDHTRHIVAYAHMRGLRVGLGIQLFGGASLQHSLTLVPRGATDVPASIDQRLGLLGDIPLDSIQLSFGEFSGEEPQVFIDTLNLAYERIQVARPGATVTATIHVGNFPSTHVTYMGNDLLYYFLVQYADSRIVPWVHTVMYFNLFETVSGSYGHTEFDLHREYLFDRLAAHQPVSYNPETAYWITFDDSVPLYLPLYVRSRLHDIQQIRARATTDGTAQLDSHVTFSSGWEWGYWQHDWATLHMTMRMPASTAEIYHQMLDPLPQGSAVADIVNDLVDIEHRAFIDEELSGYTSGTDTTFDIGLAMGVWSEPRRQQYDDIVAMSPAERTAFRADVVARLRVLETDLRGIESRLSALAISEDDPWLGEIVDGVRATRVRVQFAAILWNATVDLADGMNIDAQLAMLDPIEAEAAAVAAHRLPRFHAPNGDVLVAESMRNALIYHYGYLRHANNQCFYRRDRIELANHAHGTSVTLPNCVL